MLKLFLAMYYLIYKITNTINGKFYIGKHKTDRLDDDYFGSGTILKMAQSKYGIENFTKTILFYCANEAEMNLLEKCVVNSEFLKRDDIYNLKEGGEGGGQKGIKRSEETKKRMRDAQKKLDHSKFIEGGKKTRFTGKEVLVHRFKKGNVPWNTGIKRKSSDFDNLRKPVSQYSKDGDLIATFDSLKSASIATGILKSSISFCCLGRYKSAGGFIWRYE